MLDRLLGFHTVRLVLLNCFYKNNSQAANIVFIKTIHMTYEVLGLRVWSLGFGFAAGSFGFDNAGFRS